MPNVAIAWVSVGVAGPVHWERLPQPSAPVVDVDRGRDLVALDAQGRVHRWASGWTLLGGPVPDGADRVVSGLDGSVWAWGEGGIVHRLWPPGQPAQAVPVDEISSLVVEADGTTWVAGLFGQAGRGVDGGWEQVTGLGDDHLFVLTDPGGGVWFFSDRDGGVAIPRGGAETESVATGMTPWSAQRHGFAIQPGVGPVIVPGHALAFGGDRRWEQDARGVRRDGTPVPLPTRAGARLWALSDGGAVAFADGDVFRTQPGPGPAFQPLAATWSLQRFGDVVAAHPGDIDGDGLDDLYVVVDGTVHVLLQSADGWQDRTAARLGTPRPVALLPMVACDLDGNGRSDLLARDPVGPDGAAPFRVLRALPGAVRVEEPLALRSDLDKGMGEPACQDFDGDGDVDLALTRGGYAEMEGTVALLLGRAGGPLREADGWSDVLGGGWPLRILGDDVDDDGDVDLVVPRHWGADGVFEQRDGVLVDRSLHSGIAHDDEAPVGGAWLADVDGDGRNDLVLGGAERPRLLRGTAPFAWQDVSSAWGLATTDLARGALLVGDLVAEGGADLLWSSPAGWRLWAGGPTGLVDRSASLPRTASGRAVLIDIGGDGDLDVLTLAPSTDAWENLGPPARASVDRWLSNGVVRRLGWTSWQDIGALLAMTLLVVRRPTWSRAVEIGVGLMVVLPVWLVALEWPAGPRLALSGATAGLTAIVPAVLRSREATRRARQIGPYVVERRVGAGSMGTVYEARERGSRVRVALKVVHAEALRTAEDLAAYRREAALGARIDDAHVVRVLGFGESHVFEAGRRRPAAWLAMEFVDGPTLRQLLGARGPLAVAEAADIVNGVALGLRAVHAAGIVHRDVKPENVALTRRGVVKLMDFGAASRLSQTATAGDVLGTLGYLAPEQARGDRPEAASDVWSLGVVLFELLEGRRPFPSTDVVGLLAQIRDAVPTLPSRTDLPPEVGALLGRMLDADPERRPSAADVAEALARWRAVGARHPDAAPRAQPRSAAPSAVVPRVGVFTVARLYLRHVREGGSPDLVSFGVRLLRSGQADGAVAPTVRKPDQDGSA